MYTVSNHGNGYSWQYRQSAISAVAGLAVSSVGSLQYSVETACSLGIVVRIPVQPLSTACVDRIERVGNRSVGNVGSLYFSTFLCFCTNQNLTLLLPQVRMEQAGKRIIVLR